MGDQIDLQKISALPALHRGDTHGIDQRIHGQGPSDDVPILETEIWNVLCASGSEGALKAEPSWRNGLRQLILKHLVERGPMTARDAAGFCQVSVEAVAPRFSELEELGLVRDTGERRHSVSGKGRTQKVWEATGLEQGAAPDTSTRRTSPLPLFSNL